ncbi:hypothetical protein [Streptomyces sp. Tue6028]|uniref:hypothetical protein n=1 Tax=Streptomyces sp. Tue6028 TaxID=2036037 RepID=UPI003D739C84
MTYRKRFSVVPPTVGLVTTAVLGASAAAPAHADDNSTNEVRVACDTPALIAAVEAANAAQGSTTLRLPNQCHYTLTAAAQGETGLPPISGDIRVVSRGAVIQRDTAAAPFRIFEVASGGDLSLQGVTITGGSTTTDGGGIAVRSGGTLKAASVTVRGNRTDTDAGGIDVAHGATAAFKGSLITSNEAGDQGGGLNADGTVGLTSTTISFNRATRFYGGGVNIDEEDARLTLRDSAVRNNTSGVGSGGLDLDNGFVDIHSSRVTGNSSGEFAGGIYNNSQSLTIDRSEIANNATVDESGGIETYGKLSVTDSKITGNRVENGASGSNDGGGGITVYSGTVSLKKVEVVRNTVEGENAKGGGISLPNAADAVVNLDQSLISRNVVVGTSSIAGGIHNEGGSISLRHTPVTANRADKAPGGIWTDTQFVSAERSSIIRNVPTNCAGSPVIITGCKESATTATPPSVPFLSAPENSLPNKL